MGTENIEALVAKTWNAEKHAEYVNRKAELIKEADELRDRISDRSKEHSDVTVSNEDLKETGIMNYEHAAKMRELEWVANEIDRMERRRPVNPKSDRVNSALARWRQGGPDALSGEERQAHVIKDSIPTGFDRALNMQDIKDIRVPGTVSEVFIEKAYRCTASQPVGSEERPAYRCLPWW